MEWSIMIPAVSMGLSIGTVAIMAYFAHLAERKIVEQTKAKINGKIENTKRVLDELVNGK